MARMYKAPVSANGRKTVIKKVERCETPTKDSPFNDECLGFARQVCYYQKLLNDPTNAVDVNNEVLSATIYLGYMVSDIKGVDNEKMEEMKRMVLEIKDGNLSREAKAFLASCGRKAGDIDPWLEQVRKIAKTIVKRVEGSR